MLTAAVLHASWNAMVKGVSDQAGLFIRAGLVSATIAVALLPWVALPAPESWPWLLASVVVHVAYNLGLVAAYRLGDFSQTYPLARGLGPVIATGVAYLALAEPLPLPALAGVLLVSGAIAVLGLTPWRRVRANRPAVVAALVTGVTIGSYTVIDGVGVRLSDSAAGYTLILVGLQGVGTLPVLAWLTWRRSAARSAAAPAARPETSAAAPAPAAPPAERPAVPPAGRATAASWSLAVTATALSIGAYGLVLWAQTKGALGAIAALRECSVVVAAVIGAVVFRETLSRLRIVASVVITAGVVLLAAAGG